MAKRRVTKNAVETALPGQTRLSPSERLSDLPLSRGRQAKGLLVFGQEGAYLQLNNSEDGPLLWRLGLTRTAKADPVQAAASFNPHGSRFVNPMAEPNSVSAEPAQEAPPATVASAIDGIIEFGLQTPDDKEYFLSRFGDLGGVLRIQRKADGSWKASLSNSNVPRVLSADAVAEGLMPPQGHSGLPKSLEAVVPSEYHYWKAGDPEQARSIRDALVEQGFFSDDCIKAVDGELRKVEVKYFIFEPQTDVATTKRLHVPTFADRVMKVIPERFIGKAFTPMSESEDWLEALDKNDAPDTLAILSPVDRTTSPREMTRAVATLKGDFLLEHQDTRYARAVFSKAGVSFTLRGAAGHVFCSSFAPATLQGVSILKAASVKTIEVQSIPIYIDRPKGFVQTGKDENGNEWSRTYLVDYGFLPRTKGGDCEELDVFVGPAVDSDRVFWVTQNKADGRFDEYKVFVGFATPRDARDCYAAHIPTRFYAGMSETSIGQLKALAGADTVELAKCLAVNAIHKVSGVPFDEVRRAVNAALTAAYPPKQESNSYPSSCGPYVEDLYDDRAIYFNEGKLWSIGYSYAGGEARLSGQPSQVVRTYQAATNAETLAPGAPTELTTPVEHRRRDTLKEAENVFARALGEVEKRTIRIATAKDAGAEERYVLGIVLEPDVIDAQNDVYTADEIRRASERFMEMHRNMGLMHKQVVNDKVQILENFLAPIDMTIGDTVVKKGTWLMGVRIRDDELWSAVKSGKLTGFSIGGSAIRTPVEQGV